jgi:hypothetical protein
MQVATTLERGSIKAAGPRLLYPYGSLESSTSLVRHWAEISSFRRWLVQLVLCHNEVPVLAHFP